MRKDNIMYDCYHVDNNRTEKVKFLRQIKWHDIFKLIFIALGGKPFLDKFGLKCLFFYYESVPKLKKTKTNGHICFPLLLIH